MTREEKNLILERAIDRAYEQIDHSPGDQMHTLEFRTLLKNLSDMEWMRGPHEWEPPDEESDSELPEKALPRVHSERVGNVIVSEVVQRPETSAAPATEPEPSTGVEEPQYKMTDVRAALATARGKGINVSEIIRSFGAENFQQIRPEQYPAIMAKLAEV